jgi:hypothetical protein
VRSLAGIGVYKKASKRTPNAYSAFCSKKLAEVNEGMVSVNTPSKTLKNIIFSGKESGNKTTLRNYLQEHSKEVSTEFSALPNDERAALLAAHHEAKREKENTTKKLSNVSISKAVDSKIRLVTSTVCSYHFLQQKLNSL